ncbi:glycosyltransferase family protein [Pseudoalteromonas sp. SMS1]|uniref:cytidylyltransferase domain-containing protein n=1 Tax=Pseudoalteromonas sp. SMS1 TaxID=2908894 RepID=UPI001F30E7D2|nr:glycosyltransferase family protein [Pseudoalteromonas sp. SMS1]MCF2859366.1 glycosyltransferase family protein [Pseudoalteromonas sp. SMS1]
MVKTVAFIQARMASSRLPGKVLKPLNGLPVILHMIERLKQASRIDSIVVVTSVNQENDVLCDTLNAAGVNVFRGSEDDVLGRFCEALKVYPAEQVVRLTADSPFICPEIVDQLISYIAQNDADYGYLNESYPEGVDCEVIRSTTLQTVSQLATRESEREHVTLYLFNHPDFCNMIELCNETQDSHYRFTLDTNEDWQVISAMAAHFNTESLAVNYEQIKQFFDTNQSIYEINQHIIRNEGLEISLQKESDANEH